MRTNTSTRVIVPMSPWNGPAFSTNTTAASFASIVPTTTKPSTNSSTGIAILPADNAVFRGVFYGEGADGDTFDVKIVGWSRVWADGASVDPPANPDKTVEWVPCALAHLTCTLGTASGAASGVIGGADHHFADTIASTYASAAVNILSPGDNIPGFVEISTSGFQMIGVYFDMTGATNGNLLYTTT